MSETLILIGSLSLLHLLALMSPGPDFVVAVKNSLRYNRRIGVLTALGFAVGTMVHVTYSLLGLAYLISQSVLLFTFIKVLGASYLIYLGIKAILSKGMSEPTELTGEVQNTTGWKAFREGLITNVLNPKATLYFLSVFTLFLSPETSPVVLTSLAVVIFTTTFLWFSLVAVFMTTTPIRKVFLRFSAIIDRVLGVVLVGLGLKLLLSTK